MVIVSQTHQWVLCMGMNFLFPINGYWPFFPVQVELIAVSTLFQVPIYVASKNNSLFYHWRKYSPILVVPGKQHIEIIHLNKSHFGPALSPHEVSKPTILRKEYQGGVITD